MKHYSPLRYPGGKNKLSAFLAKICIDNNITGHYVEPYSGGASVALFLLLEGFVSKITINDKDKSIYAFWYSVLFETEKLIELIKSTDLTIEEWKKQKIVQNNKDKTSLLELGFSTFYLNRTNRSGIINAGVIGGFEQNGNYLMNCRYNKADLIERIKVIALKKEQISLYNLDAIELIDRIQEETKDENVVFYFDPPYYLKANSLYMNYYKESDHKIVSDKIKSIKNIKWIVSYDNVPQIQNLYSGIPKKEYSFKHLAYNSRVGREILFFSRNLQQPSDIEWNPLEYKMINKQIKRIKTKNHS
ncbi:MAG: DNA adenine methylase [Draconibacterium sp.]